jgi:RHS repeat-associated protein
VRAIVRDAGGYGKSLDVSFHVPADIGPPHPGGYRNGLEVLDEITYDSFGNVLNETNSSAGDRFKFTARELDAALSLYYYRARWYDLQIGRFLREDPLSFTAGDTNLYRYVFNSPVNFRDPSGELPPIVIVVFMGAVVGAAFFGTPNVANAPGPNDPVLAGPVIDPEGAVFGTFVGAAYGLGIWCVHEGIAFVATRISPSGGIITGEGMTKQAVLRAFSAERE